MTQDEIIRMAREAGWVYELFETIDEGNGLEIFARLVAEATKEKLAKAFEGEEHGQISAAIRSMK